MKCSPTARSRGHAGATTIIKFITPPEWGGTTTTLTRQNPTLMIACSQNAPCLLLCYVALLKCAYGGILMLPRRDLSTHAQSRDVCTLNFLQKNYLLKQMSTVVNYFTVHFGFFPSNVLPVDAFMLQLLTTHERPPRGEFYVYGGEWLPRFY